MSFDDISKLAREMNKDYLQYFKGKQTRSCAYSL
jgi:hypothetical protein